MSDTYSRTGPAAGDQTRAAPGGARVPGGGPAPGPPRRRRHRGRRIAIVSVASVLVLVCAVALAGYLVINHLASSVHRIPVTFPRLAAAAAPAAGTAPAMTVLITGQEYPGQPDGSGMIMLMHINAGDKAGGVVSLPPGIVVSVPGHGRATLSAALADGGPSLLVRTVEQATGVQLQHYARIDFAQIPPVIDAVGGVNVSLPAQAASFGHTFTAGTNHLTGTTALYYARQPSLTEEQRVLRQENLVRAILDKIANDNLLTSPVSAYRVVSALTAALTVDSNFTNSGLESLASQLRRLGSGAWTFVTAPTQVSGSGQPQLSQAQSAPLWSAIRQDALAAYAARYPATVTPAAPH